ncbi:MAG: TRAP transporter TatT component family protein [Verrucomicrobiota bacterium]
MRKLFSVCIQIVVLSLLAGCSVKQLAMNKVGDALSGSGTVFAGDEDPELIKDALPFSLKLMESILAETPKHEGLLLQLCSGFTQYSYGFVQLEADIIEDDDYELAEELRERAAKLYLRANRYGIRGLEVRYPGFGDMLKDDLDGAVALLEVDDVELAYWTALSWVGGVSLSLDNPALVGNLQIVEKIMDRCLELDPEFDDGSLHGFFITYSMSRLTGEGDPIENATKHYLEAKRLSGGLLASVNVAYAESVALEKQDRDLFVKLLEEALAIDVNAKQEWRLNNLLYQDRAKWLLDRVDDLIF